MKVSCLQENLARGLSMVSRAVAARSVLPVLGNVLVATDEGRLKLAATNLEMGITCWIGAKVEQAGSTTVPARTFVDFVNALPNEQVGMQLDTRRMSLKLRCASFTSEIKCMDAQEFPVLPSAGAGEGIALNVDDLREMIAQVALAAATDDTRPILTGVLVKVEGETLTMAAADGFRLSVRTTKLSAAVKDPIKVIVPARALNELGRLIGDGDELVWMFLPAGRGQVIFRMKDAELSSALIEGTFPDFSPIIPKSCSTRTVMTTSQFLKACRAADIFARQASHSARLKVTPGADSTPGNLQVMATAAETGEGETVVEASVEGQAIEIAFNVKYLVDVLSIVKTPNVALETTGPASPGVIKPVGQDDFLHVIMPMHLGR
ncbi:MAG: DNA polymerase III subunit beta [Chloroflexi bacterium]|jgi:DNA polymerase-3 subunit beta|nr:DNA polymerase III subunit beta [Chloroflexota bacterium]